MDKLKAKLTSLIESLLKKNEMLTFNAYLDKNKNKAFSIFGFEIDSKSNLPQTAKDIIITARKLGKSASYSPPDRFNDEGSIYIGTPSTNDSTVAEGISDLF